MFEDKVENFREYIFDSGYPEYREISKSTSEFYFRCICLTLGGLFGGLLYFVYFTGLYILYGFTKFINWITKD